MSHIDIVRFLKQCCSKTAETSFSAAASKSMLISETFVYANKHAFLQTGYSVKDYYSIFRASTIHSFKSLENS